MSKEIFRNYDIRGIYPDQINSLVAEHVGRAFGTLIQGKYGKNVVVGCDNRKSSPEIKDKLVYGLMSTGCYVTDIGLSLTPIIQFLTFDRRFDVGVVVTASHNPKEFNGFRFCGKRAEPVFGDDIVEISDCLASENYKKEQGNINYEELSDLYESFLLDKFKFKKRLRVLVDCGNGTSSVIAINIFRKLGVDVASLYCNLDGDYPHGVPDPENNVFMEALSNEVKKGSFDVGFAFDTDADRFGVVDEKGIVYENDKVLALLSKKVLAENKGEKVVFDVKSSYFLEDFIRKFGGEPEMIRTGHPYFINELKKGAVLGAEFSGHTFFGDKYYGFDDGIYAACRILEVLDESSSSLSELFEEFPKTYHTDEIKIPISDKEKFTLVEKIRVAAHADPKLTKIVGIDGVRAYLGERTWFLVRASNTTPFLSIRFESETKEGINSVTTFVKGFFPQLNDFYVHFS